MRQKRRLTDHAVLYKTKKIVTVASFIRISTNIQTKCSIKNDNKVDWIRFIWDETFFFYEIWRRCSKLRSP